MNEEKLKQILNEIGQIDVPPDIARIADQTSQRFTAVLNLPQPRYFTPLRLLAAAAVIAVAFAAGRWSIPAPSLNTVAYAPAVSSHSVEQKNENGFWRQKAMAATQPGPFARTSPSFTEMLKDYKQYHKEKYYD